MINLKYIIGRTSIKVKKLKAKTVKQLMVNVKNPISIEQRKQAVVKFIKDPTNDQRFISGLMDLVNFQNSHSMNSNKSDKTKFELISNICFK